VYGRRVNVNKGDEVEGIWLMNFISIYETEHEKILAHPFSKS
jgi:hypothetical protein